MPRCSRRNARCRPTSGPAGVASLAAGRRRRSAEDEPNRSEQPWTASGKFRVAGRPAGRGGRDARAHERSAARSSAPRHRRGTARRVAVRCGRRRHRVAVARARVRGRNPADVDAWRRRAKRWRSRGPGAAAIKIRRRGDRFLVLVGCVRKLRQAACARRPDRQGRRGDRAPAGCATHLERAARTRRWISCWLMPACRRRAGRGPPGAARRRASARCRRRAAGCCARRRRRRSGSTCGTPGCRAACVGVRARVCRRGARVARRVVRSSAAPRSRGGSIPERCSPGASSCSASSRSASSRCGRRACSWSASAAS